MLINLPKEFSLENFGFNHSEINDFVRSQWQHGVKSTNYVIYRWFVACLFIISLSLSLEEIQNEREWKIWAIYLTRWGLLLNVFTNFLSATLVSLHNYNVVFQNKINESKRIPKGIQIYWALHNVTVTLALLITFVYWGLVYKDGTEIDTTNILNHIVNSVILIIDIFVVRHPHRIYHVIYLHVLLIIFLIFSFIYYNAGGLNLEYEHAIYPILDWTNFSKTLLFSLFVLIAVGVLHCSVHGVYRLRIWIYCNRKMENNNNVILMKVAPAKSVTIEVDNPAYDVHI